MPVSTTGGPIKALTKVFWLARKSGVLGTRWGQGMFTSAYFIYKRYLEDPFYHLVRRHPELFVGGNVLDIGANIGYTALVFSGAIDSGCKVYAFEPERFNYSLLERSAGSRRAEGRIVPILSAVGDRDGTIELWQNEYHHADHRVLTEHFKRATVSSRLVPTPMLSVDSFMEKQGSEFQVRFIKIDVQGYEIPVCKGMERTLAANPKAILALEYMPEAMRELGFQPEELLNWLNDRNYRAYTLEKHGRFHEGIADFPGRQGYADVLFSRERLGTGA